MRRIFTFSFLAIALTLASFNSFGQTCTGTTQNFNGASSTTFDGNRITGSGTFTPLTATNNELRSTVTTSSTSIYAITSPTFNTPTNTSPINLSFTYGVGNATKITLTNVQYAIKYLSTSGTVVQTAPVNYTSGTCITVTRPSDMADTRYQIVALYTVTFGDGSNTAYIFYDNFGTNSVAGASSPLPVKFSAFEAKSASNGVALNWSVGTENNVSGYAIEKSTDGRSFSKIGFVAADGKSSYSFVDAQGAGAVAYYRIKSVDNDGRFNFSSVAVLKGGKSAIVLKAFPSPFVNKLSVQHASATAGSLIAISSEDGRTIKSVVPAIGTQQTEIDLTTAKAGLYLVRYSSGNGPVETLKVLKQ